jgi:hypothetical protein
MLKGFASGACLALMLISKKFIGIRKNPSIIINKAASIIIPRHPGSSSIIIHNNFLHPPHFHLHTDSASC